MFQWEFIRLFLPVPSNVVTLIVMPVEMKENKILAALNIKRPPHIAPSLHDISESFI